MTKKKKPPPDGSTSTLSPLQPGTDRLQVSDLGVAARDGLTRQQFARHYLMRLGIGHDLTRIALNPKYPRKLARETELLALRPELNHIE